MSYLMGIDLGTSSVKVLIMDEYGKVKSIASEEYDIDIPQEGFSEQDPAVWWDAVVHSIHNSLDNSGLNAHEIKSIGLSGQMHGTVLINKEHKAIRPAIIHCDQRSKKQVREIYELLGKDMLYKTTYNPVFPGFQIASLLWVLENEIEIYNAAYKVLLPKDYIRLMLTGEIVTEFSDASSTLAFDIINQTWSEFILNKLNIDTAKFPPCKSPFDIAGGICEMASRRTGLKVGTPVVMGGADQPMQALGNGAIHEGIVTSAIGTGGQIFTPVCKPVFNPKLNTFTFCNLEKNSWYTMGAILNAGLCMKWLNEKVLHYENYKSLDSAAEKISPGSKGLVFLPHLSGERVPFADYQVKGMFFGLTLEHNGACIARAVMEGVTYALRERIETFKSLGIKTDKVISSGGGANSSLWLQIQADIYNMEVYKSNMVEQACVGAAMAAGIGTGIYNHIEEACNIVVRIDENPIVPNYRNVQVYDHYFGVYRAVSEQNCRLNSINNETI